MAQKQSTNSEYIWTPYLATRQVTDGRKFDVNILEFTQMVLLCILLNYLSFCVTVYFKNIHINQSRDIAKDI